ncbi:MAG TPA: polysaccharide lyase family 7 protein [Telluria sp.]|nr:polysaccharide lyase family 7 protein [Telluria sp.]
MAIILTSASAFATTTKLSVPQANVTASSSDSNLPPNADDGSLTTRWSADATSAPQWIQYNLGGCYQVDYVKLAWLNGDQRHYNITVQLSTDGNTWTNVYAGTSNGISNSLLTYDFPDAPARYVRMQSTGSDVNKFVSLTEMEVWTTGAGTCPATGLDPNLKPGQNFPVMVNNYKLTTFNSSGNQVDISPLGATYSDIYFFSNCFDSTHCYANVEPGAVIFKTPSGGETTGTTKFGRVELRELTNNWTVGQTYTNVESGTVRVINQPGTSTTNHTGEIIFAQIHGDSTGAGSEALKLRWSNGAIEVGIKLAAGDTEVRHPVLSAVALKDKIDYTISATGTSSAMTVVLSVTVTSLATGAVRTAPNQTYVYQTANWSGVTLYFKAGSYNQDDNADGTQSTVAYSALNLTHQ